MPTEFEKIIQKFNDLAVRMRLMLTFILIIFLYFLFELFWYSPTQQQIENVSQKIEATDKQIAQLIQIQQQYNQSIFLKRSDPKHQKLAQINQQIAKVRNELTDKTLNLIPPEAMAQVVKTIIASSKLLKLEYLAKQQTVALTEQSQPQKATKKPQQEAPIQLYRHSMKITLTGSYQATYQFLDALETMEKKVAFDSLDYQVKTYPKAEITLVISTLSLKKGWIGG